MIYEEAINNTSYKKIMNVFNKKLQFLKYYERQNFKLICLWNACRTFDENRNISFITHLYTILKYSTLKEYYKYVKHNSLTKTNTQTDTQCNSSDILRCTITDHIDSLIPIYKDILEKRFISKMSLKEISKEYNIRMKECKNLIERAKNSLKISLTET